MKTTIPLAVFQMSMFSLLSAFVVDPARTTRAHLFNFQGKKLLTQLAQIWTLRLYAVIEQLFFSFFNIRSFLSLFFVGWKLESDICLYGIGKKAICYVALYISSVAIVVWGFEGMRRSVLLTLEKSKIPGALAHILYSYIWCLFVSILFVNNRHWRCFST